MTDKSLLSFSGFLLSKNILQNQIEFISYEAINIHLSGMQTTSFCIVLQCHLWRVWLRHMFSHYFINDAVFGKKFIEHKVIVLIFSTNYLKHVSF